MNQILRPKNCVPKRITTLLLASALLAAMAMSPSSTKAAGSAALVAIEAVGSNSAKADGSSKVTFKVTSYWNTCPTVPYWRESTTCDDGSAAGKHYNANNEVYLTVSGSGNTLGNTSVNGGGTYVASGSDGTATFTLASTVAETKTISATSASTATTTATFTSGVTSTTQSKPQTTTPTPTATPAPTPPAAPTTGLTLNTQTITTERVASIPSGKAITLSGKTVPNGVVTLYIFSTPRQATATADAQGSWVYQLTGLEPGSHHVEATVTDPSTQLTSDRATLAVFTVTRPVASATPAAAKKKAMPIWIWLVGLLAVVGLTAGVAWWLHRRHTHLSSAAPTSTEAPTPPQ